MLLENLKKFGLWKFEAQGFEGDFQLVVVNMVVFV